jgi:type IV pilus assembly protein PilA
MLQKLRTRSQGEAGFTLVELLVVMLILGLLAAIAIPSFFNQRDKAKDADAKEAVRTSETAMETFATDNDGAYTGATGGDLEGIEATLTDAPNPVAVSLPANAPHSTAVAGDNADNSYSVEVESETGNIFYISRHNDGTTELTCDTGGEAGCPSSNVWG